MGIRSAGKNNSKNLSIRFKLNRKVKNIQGTTRSRILILLFCACFEPHFVIFVHEFSDAMTRIREFLMHRESFSVNMYSQGDPTIKVLSFECYVL